MVSRETAGPPPPLPPWLAPATPGLSAYAQLLAETGVDRGLIGPREVPRLWERHLLNCAVVADPSVGLIPMGGTVADVGTGAGLPGLVWALARPDLTVVLVEPLLRRTTFLEDAVVTLGVGERVTVWRGRAEDVPVELRDRDVVTARAVAPMGRLAGWLAPLLRPDGLLVALKGSSASDEVREAAAELTQAGLVDVTVQQVGVGVVDPPTTIVVGRRGTAQ